MSWTRASATRAKGGGRSAPSHVEVHEHCRRCRHDRGVAVLSRRRCGVTLGQTIVHSVREVRRLLQKHRRAARRRRALGSAVS